MIIQNHIGLKSMISMQIKSLAGMALTICSALHTIAPKACRFTSNWMWFSIDGERGSLWVWLLPRVPGDHGQQQQRMALQHCLTPAARNWFQVQNILVLALIKHLGSYLCFFRAGTQGVARPHGVNLLPLRCGAEMTQALCTALALGAYALPDSKQIGQTN